jgi:purine-binding chemotaxis protein CheW
MAAPVRLDDGERILSFLVESKQFGLRAADVIEVQRTPTITRVPNGSSSLAGLMNFHGTAIAVVRMSSVLGLATSNASGRSETRVVVYGQTPPVALLVDEVVELGTASGRRESGILDVSELLAKEFVAKSVERVRIGEAGRQAYAPVVAEVTVPLLSFRVASQRYALPLESVSEVVVLPADVVVLPRSDTAAVGMLDFRASVLPLISVAALLGLVEGGGRQHVLIVSLEGSKLGLVVGRVEGVVSIPQAAIEDVPAILQRGEGDAEIDGIARHGRVGELISILSPGKLFRNREIVQAIAQSTSGTAAMPEKAIETSVLQFVVFRLGRETYGLPIGAVDEIVQLPERLTRVPGAPEFVAGVMNLRGKALPLIDQRRRFESATESAGGRVIVSTVGELRAGFIVDSVSEILRVPASAVTAAPSMPGDGVKVFDRIAATDGGMVLVVDPKELLDRAERDLLKNFKPAAGTAVPS